MKPAATDRNIYAIHGVEPEVLAYGMAKYSRSALPLADALQEISTQKAEKFLNTFYFAYGHRSIADLAHIPMAVENVSLLAAIEVVDEQRWDGQERSTRYQDFSKRLYHVPEDLDEVEAAHFHKSVRQLFDAYDMTFQAARKELSTYPAPADMKADDRDRTLRARAFDIARYCLPMATLTSVGQITSARTLEGQITRLKSHPVREIQRIGVDLQAAALGVAFNPNTEVLDMISEELHRFAKKDLSTHVVANMAKWVNEPVHPAPTLLKYCEPDPTCGELTKFVREQLKEVEAHNQDLFSDRFAADSLVDLTLVDWDCMDVEIAATLFYENSNHPFYKLYRVLRTMNRDWVSNFVEQAAAIRGPHAELSRAFRAGSGLVFDIYMDIGGMRDMHRHRRCTQIFQPYDANEWAIPELGGLPLEFKEAMNRAKANFEIMRSLREVNGHDPETAAYLLPLGMKRRFLMKMDTAQLDYIAELRTKPAGHISYRRVAWEMFKELKRCAPGLAKALESRVVDPEAPIDIYNR